MAQQVQRYATWETWDGVEMREEDDGAWVRWEDVAPILAEADRTDSQQLKAEIARLKNELDLGNIGDLTFIALVCNL